jgi:two-component system cell cycle sensor histidine kinase/response regulator CckA
MIALEPLPLRRTSGPPGYVAPHAHGDDLIDALRRYARDRGPADADGSDPELSLMELQKLATLGRMATDVVHDFGNLITVMLGYSDLLLAAAEHGVAPGPEYLCELRRAAERASALTSRLIGFSRPSADELTPLDLSHLVRGLSAVLGRLIGAAGRLVFTTDPAAGAVMADARQVEQAVINLVLNARDAIGVGGRVEVVVELVRLAQPLSYDDAIRGGPGVVPGGGYVRLRVRDDGCGMDADTIGRLFRPFFTTKADGAGLGLTIVARVAYKAGAAVVVDSARGAGTTVDLYFPRIEA